MTRTPVRATCDRLTRWSRSSPATPRRHVGAHPGAVARAEPVEHARQPCPPSGDLTDGELGGVPGRPRWWGVVAHRRAPAGRLVRANGFARDKGAALWRYNNSWAYVGAITHHAEVMRRDPRQLRGYLAWQVYYLTEVGSVWLPEGYDHVRPVPVRAYVARHPERLA